MKPHITDVFFDLDHTLWDFDKNSTLAFQEVFLNNSININLEEFLKIYIPKNLEYWKLYQKDRITKENLRYLRLKDTFNVLGYQLDDKVINKLSNDYLLNLPKNNYLVKDTIEILEYLKPKYKLHIITNGFEEVQKAKLVNSQIDHFFTHIVNSDMAGVKKPNPLIFEMALNKAKAAPANAIMIGDSYEADIIGAGNVGMNAIHFEVHKANVKHNVLINNLLEIKHYL